MKLNKIMKILFIIIDYIYYYPKFKIIIARLNCWAARTPLLRVALGTACPSDEENGRFNNPLVFPPGVTQAPCREPPRLVSCSRLLASPLQSFVFTTNGLTFTSLRLHRYEISH